MRDFSDELGALRRRFGEAEAYLDRAGLEKRMAELEATASKSDLWDDPDAARQVTTELARVKDDVDELAGIEGRLSDAETLFQLATEEGDESVEEELVAAVAALARELDQLELRS